VARNFLAMFEQKVQVFAEFPGVGTPVSRGRRLFRPCKVRRFSSSISTIVISCRARCWPDDPQMEFGQLLQAPGEVVIAMCDLQLVEQFGRLRATRL
jgi:hypothetical protein